jgi:hypothetical protein
VIDKRNKAQLTISFHRTLALEELEKRKSEEARKARYKRDGGQRYITSDYSVIKAGDICLRIYSRERYLEQKRVQRAQKIGDRADKLGTDKWRVVARAAGRRGRSWEPRDRKVLRRYNHWIAELLNFYRTGNCTLHYIKD